MQESDHDLLVRLNERVGNFLSRFDEHLKWAEGQIVENRVAHELLGERLSAIERWRFKWIGAVTVIIFLLNMVSALAARHLVK